MNPHREFLLNIFAALNAAAVPYCVLRNYDQLLAEATTDLDLLVAPRRRVRFIRVLHEAATHSGYRCVQIARFTCDSHVFWNARAGFIRVDFETELRWQLYPVLAAETILAERRPRDEFFIPHPKHESVIILTAALLWRGALSERYRKQLIRLHAAGADAAEWRHTFRQAFGSVGDALVACQAQLATSAPGPDLADKVRRSVRRATFLHGRWLLPFAGNLVTDIRRLFERLRRPAGLSLFFITSRSAEPDFASLISQLQFLFPPAKSVVRPLATDGSKRPGLTSRLRGERRRVLFKGGLFIGCHRVAQDPDLTSALRALLRGRCPARTMLCMEDSAGRLYLAHPTTGFMATCTPDAPARPADFSRKFVEFTATVLAHCTAQRRGTPAVAARRGTFCVLVGLDGAGKTTLARNLCEYVAMEGGFSGVRYFHWRPRIFRSFELPLPEFKNLPRKSPLAPNCCNAILSGVRLLKNVLLIHIAFAWRVRPLLKRNHLVLIDRFFYNYYLDPVSMKYAGPAVWIAWVRRLLPQPDVVIKLAAPPEILRQRKQELSDAEIRRQMELLADLPVLSSRVLAADAAQPAAAVAHAVLAEIRK
ncbi:MAG TPA: hypothetical protein PKN95_05345 [Verrucomicrobiota bacterium]|nr:hypothetical protein [Verrucomicrobiota bacterium]HNT13512.1 hypothetical protein [Verrucomicrobiota bacterium]